MTEINSIYTNEVIDRKFQDLAADSHEIYEAANTWFVRQGPDIVFELIRGLTWEALGSVCHSRILILLRYFKVEETIPVIIKTLHLGLEHRDPILITGTIEALSVFCNPAVTIALTGLLKENDLDIVKHAAASLGKTGDLNAVEPLLNLLESDNASLRYSVVRGLTRLDGLSVHAALKQHLQNETDPEIRELIVSALKGEEE